MNDRFSTKPEAEDMGEFLWVGGDVAVDFANTRIIAGGVPTDLLRDVPAAERWMRGAGFLANGASPNALDAAFLQNMRLLRDSVREGLEERIAGREVPQRVIEIINESLRVQTGHFALREDAGRLRLRFESGNAATSTDFLARIAYAAADFFTGLDVARLRKCESASCILLFYDTSKNGTRRWCRMGACGNRAKAAAHYKKSRATP